MQRILSQIPPIAWDTDVDQHLILLNEHVRDALSQHFPWEPRKPRKTFFKADTWDTVRYRRTDKRIGRRAQELHRKIVSHLLFRAWRKLVFRDKHDESRQWGLTPTNVQQADAQLAAADHLAARCQWRVIRLTRELGKLTKRDTVDAARMRFQEAKHAGPEHVARHMRELLKTGRKYKPPMLQPTIVEDGMPVADSSLALGVHFATAERGELCTDIELLQTRPVADKTVSISREDIPDVGQLANAFASLSKRKAAGIFQDTGRGVHLCTASGRPTSLPAAPENLPAGAISPWMERRTSRGDRETTEVFVPGGGMAIDHAS